MAVDPISLGVGAVGALAGPVIDALRVKPIRPQGQASTIQGGDLMAALQSLQQPLPSTPAEAFRQQDRTLMPLQTRDALGILAQELPQQAGQIGAAVAGGERQPASAAPAPMSSGQEPRTFLGLSGGEWLQAAQVAGVGAGILSNLLQPGPALRPSGSAPVIQSAGLPMGGGSLSQPAINVQAGGGGQQNLLDLLRG